ncbi:hypothetical protein HAHE_24850 [Haloferula helveola]|uniref:Tyr recombinase domain-containing protein n=1 Tax=Haloferula helveola TaxID=490095 RepID=A0ABN6H7I1_9BACT|nr:hypothetical protein HAHE_24850 [Haloferula helveola]
MGRNATLSPAYQKSKQAWVLSIPPRLSSTGKRSQEYYQTKREAEVRSASLKKLEKQNRRLAVKASTDLIRDAVELDELARFHGFSGLREAFMTWAEDHERQNSSVSFGELVEAHEADHSENWSSTYLAARWKPFRNKVRGLEPTPIVTMDTDFWREWLGKWRTKEKPAPASYNQLVSMLGTVFGHEKAKRSHGHNPIEHIPRLKDVRGEVCVSTPEEVGALLAWCWTNDRDLVPYFVLGFFAGMRPLSEIKPTRFEQINFKERIIDCVTTKTHRNPRRQIPIEDNALKWLEPFKSARGSVIPSNFTKRFGAARKAAKVSWGHDIMRHSYGSYFEALHRGTPGCRENLTYNMGHSSFKTYEQKYRNGRITPKQAGLFWKIVPPQEED